MTVLKQQNNNDSTNQSLYDRIMIVRNEIQRQMDYELHYFQFTLRRAQSWASGIGLSWMQCWYGNILDEDMFLLLILSIGQIWRHAGKGRGY